MVFFENLYVANWHFIDIMSQWEHSVSLDILLLIQLAMLKSNKSEHVNPCIPTQTLEENLSGHLYSNVRVPYSESD